ncbi:MAG: sulfurtransferase [Verrucomicrobiales bacterium]|nr:sulfurtransferase [Verrucomicrobiales bacterium]|tara:strand:- start:5405 stop:5806 length:402 start_codon:yes stop_codon:yes gene_type:complete
MKKLIALATAFVLASTAAMAGEFPDISITELEKKIEAGKVTVIDVNGAKSFNSRGHIPGAINFAKVGKKLSGALPKDKDSLIVAYCGGPSCKAYKRAASAAERLGYTNVKHLSAGISGWLSAGKKVEKGGKAN